MKRQEKMAAHLRPGDRVSSNVADWVVDWVEVSTANPRDVVMIDGHLMDGSHFPRPMSVMRGTIFQVEEMTPLDAAEEILAAMDLP